jgi:hypothetical protein
MKLVYANYKEDLGRSFCVVESDRGYEYFGHARLHPDDAEWASQFTGCRIAELRAELNALKDECQWAKAEYKFYKDFVTSCTQYKNWNPEDKSAKVVFRQLNRRRRAMEKAAAAVAEKEQEIAVAVKSTEYMKREKDKKEQGKTS